MCSRKHGRPEVDTIDKRLSTGAKHYLLLLAPRLLADMDRVGLVSIVHCSGFPEHEVTSLYFEFSALCRALPNDPARVPAELWDYVCHCVQLVSTLVNATEKADIEQARHNAVSKFLPHARDTVRHEYQEQHQHGTVEFRLAALVHNHSSAEQSRELCREALRLERQVRYQSCRSLNTDCLDPSRATIVDHALTYAHQFADDAPDHFAPVDLVIRLLDLLHSVLQDTPLESGDAVMPDPIDRVVLGLGNVLFNDELGL